MGRKLAYKDVMVFLDFCCKKLEFSKKDLVFRCRNKEYSAKRAVICILLSRSEYLGLGIFNTCLVVERNWSTVQHHIRNIKSYREICNDIWAIWKGEKSEREKFFDFEQPPVDGELFCLKGA